MQQNAVLLCAERAVTEQFASCVGVVTWCVTFSGEHRLKMADHRAQRKIFGPKRVQVRGGKGIMKKSGFFPLSTRYSGNRIKEGVMGRKCGTYGRVEKFI